MTSFDAFYQELDSKALLDQHGPSLVADAREKPDHHPRRQGGRTIIMPDSREARAFRAALAKATGQPIPEGLRPQQVLPVVVSTRTGFRFGFFDIRGH